MGRRSWNPKVFSSLQKNQPMASLHLPLHQACWPSIIFGVPSVSPCTAEAIPAPLGLPAPSQLQRRNCRKIPPQASSWLLCRKMLALLVSIGNSVSIIFTVFYILSLLYPTQFPGLAEAMHMAHIHIHTYLYIHSVSWR